MTGSLREWIPALAYCVAWLTLVLLAWMVDAWMA